MLEEIKEYMRIDDDVEDILINSLILVSSDKFKLYFL